MTGRPLRVPALLAVAMLLQACTPNVTRPPEAAGPTITRGTVQSPDGVSIAFESHGSGREAIVFVHGWSCDSTYWREQVPVFARAHRVVTVDLAGHGASGRNRENWTMAAFGADVAAVANHLDLKRIVIVGHSMGGPVVVEAARLLGDRVVAVVGADTMRSLGAPPPPPEVTAQMTAQLQRDFRGGVEMFASMFFTPRTDPALARWIVDDMSAGPPDVALAAGAGMQQWPWQAALTGLRQPLTLINATSGAPRDYREIEARVPSLELLPMDGVGHFVMMEDPQRFNALLGGVVARHLGN